MLPLLALYGDSNFRSYYTIGSLRSRTSGVGYVNLEDDTEVDPPGPWGQPSLSSSSAAAAAVPGALPGGTYALLAALEGAAEEGPTAAALRALVDSVPEIDGDAWMHGVGVEADRHDLPGAEDHEGHSDDDAGSDGDGGGEAFGDLLLS